MEKFDRRTYSPGLGYWRFSGCVDAISVEYGGLAKLDGRRNYGATGWGQYTDGGRGGRGGKLQNMDGDLSGGSRRAGGLGDDGNPGPEPDERWGYDDHV